MSVDHDLLNEYRQRLKERYTASELVEILEIDVSEILDAFEHLWLENSFLQEEVGINQ